MDDDLRDRILAWVEALDVGEPISPHEARARAMATHEHRHRDRRRRRVVVAAMAVLLTAGGALVRSGLEDDTVTAGPPIPRDLGELADRVAVLPTTVLGETDDARYAYRRAAVSVVGPTSVVTGVQEQWVAADGSVRQLVEGGPDQPTSGPGLLTVGGVPVRAFLDLPDDADAVAAAFATYSPAGFTGQVAPALVDALSYTGIPGPARAGVLRALDRLGMVPVPGADGGPNRLRVEGPQGSDGTRVRADFDLRTGVAVAWTLYGPDGERDEVTRFRSVEVDLRRDTRGS